MKSAFNLIGIVLAFVGVIWILQGLGVLPGSFMTGQPQWAVYGAISLVAGGIAIYIAKRKGGGGPDA